MNILQDYIVAMVNLYGIVSFEMVARVYSKQNSESINIETIRSFADENEGVLEKKFIYIEEENFVHESVLVFDNYDELIAQKANKPYYLPEKEELMKYLDDIYFERNEQYQRMLDYVRDKLVDGDTDYAKVICGDIQGLAHVGAKPRILFNQFTRRDLSFESMEEANKFMMIMMDSVNNLRLWENNGFSPSSIFEKIEKPNLKPLPDKPYIIRNNLIGRNDLCPCGSGKKYKNCCLGRIN